MSTLLQQLRGIAVDCAVDYHRKDGEWAQVFETVTKLETLADEWRERADDALDAIEQGGTYEHAENMRHDANELRALLGVADAVRS